MRRIFAFLAGRDSGQAMIFFAVLAPALFATAGIAIEGGRVFVEYRKVQAAADMAALIGAQDLPCATTDTSCISAAETQACTYATDNGFSGCTAGGTATSTASANVPPLTCSPYDFMDYGNGSTNAKCKSTTAPDYYDYVEVKLSDALGTVPMFNIPVTLSAHAVAKHGPMTSGDFTLMTLDPSKALTMSGNTTVNLIGSAYGQGGVSGGGSSSNTTCRGGWFAPTGTTVSGISSNNSGSVTDFPPGCSGSNDGTTDASNIPTQSDPYANSSVPPSQSGSFPNCLSCQQTGWWYNLDKGTWNSGGSVSGDAELFPGIYSGLSLKNGNTLYFNPGVYTFTSSFDTNHGTMCVYGAPDCNDGDGNMSNGCSYTDFSNNSTLANQWYAECSPYGYWDSYLIQHNPPSSNVPQQPYFYDNSSGTTSTTPLNGVTIYLPSLSSGITYHGNGGKDGDVFITAPNPCPGTGSYTAGSPPQVSEPAGAASGVFTYNSTYLSNNQSLPHGGSNGSTSPSTTAVYPNYDFSILGECNSSLLVWPGELQQPQHLHFAFFDKSCSSQTINGASSNNYTGIVYMPCASLKINGSKKGADGAPWLMGQLITYDADFSGTSYVDIAYRPCGAGADSCGSGYGTQLVQ